MSGEFGSLAELISRARVGDEVAIRSLLDSYGDAIRREIRFSLLDCRLRRVVEESDIFQSVVTQFVLGLKGGEFELHSAQELIGLLKTIARRRVAQQVRYWHAQRRDLRRNVGIDAFMEPFLQHRAPSPCDELVALELAEELARRLPDRDRLILQWRDDGASWKDIARRIDGRQPDAVRKQHERSLARVAAALAE